jgi:PAS domain S-box-containing protein
MDSGDGVLLSAFELSRQYREKMLRQEFGSWLLEDHIEQAVIATDPLGTVVFWNRFASDLYQYSQLEAMGQNIMGLTPSEMTQDQGMEIFSKLAQGEHWKGFFGVQRKDKSRFMAHVTDTPVLDQEGQLKFIVGVSADYTQMHDLMDSLKNLNANLEREVEVRTKDLLDREHSLRMVGAAVKESDTGVIIADEGFRIIWCNDAAQDLVRLSEEQMTSLVPWELPLKYGDADCELSTESIKAFYQSNDNNGRVKAFAKPLDTEGGRQLCLSICVQSMKGSSNRIIAIRDMTAEQEADEAHRRAEKEAAASKTKTEMIQMLSHELRTPLQGIMGVVSTILTDMDEQNSIYECLSTIAASSRLLLTLINNILDLGKVCITWIDQGIWNVCKMLTLSTPTPDGRRQNAVSRAVGTFASVVCPRCDPFLRAIC